VRAGYVRDGRGWLLTHGLTPQEKRVPVPAVEYYAALAEWALGVQNIDRRLQLCTTDEERAEAERLLHDVKRPFVLLNPGANREDKRWPAERFALVADRLAASKGLAAVVSGSPKESQVLEKVVQSAKSPIVNLESRGLTLGSLKAMIEQAALVITNDTGPRHIAAALGTPAVVLFGPTDHRWTTLPHARERILLAEPFLPEELVADRHAKACAIEKISVGDVVSAAEAMVRQ
jgi:heptosyltransferase II